MKLYEEFKLIENMWELSESSVGDPMSKAEQDKYFTIYFEDLSVEIGKHAGEVEFFYKVPKDDYLRTLAEASRKTPFNLILKPKIPGLPTVSGNGDEFVDVVEQARQLGVTQELFSAVQARANIFMRNYAKVVRAYRPFAEHVAESTTPEYMWDDLVAGNLGAIHSEQYGKAAQIAAANL